MIEKEKKKKFQPNFNSTRNIIVTKGAIQFKIACVINAYYQTCEGNRKAYFQKYSCDGKCHERFIRRITNWNVFEDSKVS